MSYSKALKYAEKVETGIDRELARRDEEAKAFFNSPECRLNEVHKQAFLGYLRKYYYNNDLEKLQRGLSYIVEDFLEEYTEEICKMFKPISKE